MKKIIKCFLITFIGISTFSSCMSINKSIREPNTIVNFNKNDFSLSDQVTATASTTKILGIDFSRILTKKTGEISRGSTTTNISLSSVPVIGNIVKDKTSNYSLYELMNQNPGYDVVFYPQYETKVYKPFLGIGFITKITTVKTTARLGKLTQ